MKTFTLTSFIFLQALFSFAQRDPSKEILVFFKEGVEQSEKLLHGKLEKTAILKKEKLKAALQKAGIEETMLEIAMPRFKTADTLKILTDRTIIRQLDMTKLFRIKVPEGRSKKELIEKLRALPEVLYAEENGTISPLLIPSDVQYANQWALNNPFNPGADIHAEDAWDIFTGNPANIIAVVDGGTDINHPDLNDKIAGADAGFGWNGHGIHVSGIAAAESNNTQGVSGVDWQARILAKRIDNVSDDADKLVTCVEEPYSYSYLASPNPSDNELRIAYKPAGNVSLQKFRNDTSSKEKSFEVKLLNDKGQVLGSGKSIGGEDIVIDTRDIQNGIYFLHITDEKKVKRQQIIIKH